MQVLTEFIKSDLTEDQILPVLRQLLPVLLAILNDAQVILSPCSTFALLMFPSETQSADSFTERIRLLSVCYRALHGEGAASTSCEGGHRKHPPGLA